jgi:hypothetical protein
MESAIRAFANWQQVLNVVGPAEAIGRCHEEWKRINAEDVHAIPPHDQVTFSVQGKPRWAREKK